MQKQEQLLKQFDRLLPYVGLWAPVNVKLFRRVVDSRCYEVRLPLMLFSVEHANFSTGVE